jgi:hypothetical protein
MSSHLRMAELAVLVLLGDVGQRVDRAGVRQHIGACA